MSQSAPTEVRFVCHKYKTLKMEIVKPQHGYYMDDTGRQVVTQIPGKIIQFTNSVYKTSDPKEIEAIRASEHFAGNNVVGRKFIYEAQPQDPHQTLVMDFVQKHGIHQLASVIQGAYAPAAGKPVSDPIAQTVAQVQQQAPQAPSQAPATPQQLQAVPPQPSVVQFPR